MRITAAEFVTSAVTPAQYPADVGPEVAFVGRSVGKSSLINTLLNRRGLAKTSPRPVRRAPSISFASMANSGSSIYRATALPR